MVTAATPNKVSTKKPKIKLDFKDSKYATGRRKNLLQKFGWKKVQAKFTLMAELWMSISLAEVTKCKSQDHLRL